MIMDHFDLCGAHSSESDTQLTSMVDITVNQWNGNSPTFRIN